MIGWCCCSFVPRKSRSPKIYCNFFNCNVKNYKRPVTLKQRKSKSHNSRYDYIWDFKSNQNIVRLLDIVHRTPIQNEAVNAFKHPICYLRIYTSLQYLEIPPLLTVTSLPHFVSGCYFHITSCISAKQSVPPLHFPVHLIRVKQHTYTLTTSNFYANVYLSCWRVDLAISTALSMLSYFHHITKPCNFWR